MSTLAMAWLLNECAAQVPDHQCFVNVGLWHGFSFFAGLFRHPSLTALGVDHFEEYPVPQKRFEARLRDFGNAQTRVFRQDFESYFRNQHQQPIGLYFYDGAHDYQSQCLGLELAHSFLAPGARVFIDDTNDSAPRQATLDFLAAHPEYHCALDERTPINRHPSFWNGLMVLEKR